MLLPVSDPWDDGDSQTRTNSLVPFGAQFGTILTYNTVLRRHTSAELDRSREYRPFYGIRSTMGQCVFNRPKTLRNANRTLTRHSHGHHRPVSSIYIVILDLVPLPTVPSVLPRLWVSQDEPVARIFTLSAKTLTAWQCLPCVERCRQTHARRICHIRFHKTPSPEPDNWAAE